MSIVVSLAAATICFAGRCAPALIGRDTRPGVYAIEHVRVAAPGYGGDALVFDIRADGVPLAIHRVWLGIPAQHRLERLRGPAAARRGITGGCINVEPEVYDALIGETELKVVG